MSYFSNIPILLLQFIETVLLSFLIGLGHHSYRRSDREDLGFGTTRTFTLIGILGFILFALDQSHLVFGIGLLGLTFLLLIYYWWRVKNANFSVISPLLGFLTFLVGAVALTFPRWFLVLFVVILLLILSEKPKIRHFSDAFSSEEAVTLSKFLILAGVILPLLPNRQIADFIPITYYQLWLAVIVVSGISYLSYLAQTYFFKEPGMLLTGILGGLYSSTATTVVIARRSNEHPGGRSISPAIVLATAMMYVRLLVLIVILGYRFIALRLLLPFFVFIVASLIAAFVFYHRPQTECTVEKNPKKAHPLELATAFTFAFLFLLFATITHFVVLRFGTSGLNILSFAAGFSDIDPFILSLLAGKFQVSGIAVAGAILLASGSNNLLKACYAISLGNKRSVLNATLFLTILFVATLVYNFWLL